jgi:hypothetical protein
MVGESFHHSGCWGEDSNHIRLGATVQKLSRLFALDPFHFLDQGCRVTQTRFFEREGKGLSLHSYRWVLILLISVSALHATTQQPGENTRADTLPKEVRGYRIHRAQVELKKPKESEKKKSDRKSANGTSEKEEYDEDEPLLVRLGEAQLVSATPLGVTFEVPVTLAAVNQSGDVDLLVFEDMMVDDEPVTLEDYVYPFKLPNKVPLTLAPPLRIFVSTPQAVLRTVDEILNSKDVWQVRGRIYVCGRFKKYLFTFKRAIPVELQTSINNPLR